MPDTRTLREQIDAIVNRGKSWEDDNREIRILAERWADEHTAAVSTVVFDEALTSGPRGIEQGITRLAMLSFVAGEESSVWNGVPGPNQWVRYRGHHVSRGSYPDGIAFSILFRAHDGGEREATFEPRRAFTTTESALILVADIDDLLDTVIEENGLPGDEIPDAEVVAPITADQARRVLTALTEWIGADPERALHNPSEAFVAAVADGTVEP